MKKSKSKKLHLFLILFFIFIGIFSGMLIINYVKPFFLKFNIKELNLSCNIPIISRRDKQIVYELNFNKNLDELNYIKIKFFDTNKSVELFFHSDDWIKLYFNKEKAVQVKFLPRLVNNKSNSHHNPFNQKICFIINNIIYLTGVVPNSILVRTGKKIFVYHLEDNLDIFKVVHDSITLNTQDFVLEDGTKIKLYNFSNIFDSIKDLDRIEYVYDEGVSVEVLNATSKSGYATFWARVLQGLGFQVTHIYTLNYLFNQVPSNVKYFVYVEPSVRNSHSFQVIKDLFKNSMYVTSKRPKGILTTSNIVIILVK